MAGTWAGEVPASISLSLVRQPLRRCAGFTLSEVVSKESMAEDKPEIKYQLWRSHAPW
jgi:hypothetical protein